MATGEKKCPQCAENVKSEARVCRFCGFQFPAESIRKRSFPAPGGCGLLVIVFLIIIVVGALRSGGTAGSSSSSPASTNQSAGAKLSPEEDLRQRTALAAGQDLKQTLRNPDSLVLEEALASDDGKILCIRYRAQNGFGGMNREIVVFDRGIPHRGGSFWNAHCKSASHNMVGAVQLGAKLS